MIQRIENQAPTAGGLRARLLARLTSPKAPGFEVENAPGISLPLAGSAYSEAGRAVVAHAMGLDPDTIKGDGARLYSESWKRRLLSYPWPATQIERLRAPLKPGFPTLHSGVLLAMAGPVARVVLAKQTIPAEYRDELWHRIIPDRPAVSLATPGACMTVFGEDLSLAMHFGLVKYCPDMPEAMRHLKATESTVRHLFNYEDVQIAASYLASKLIAHVRGNQHSMSTRNIVGVLQDCIGNPRQFGKTAIGPWLWWQPLVTDAHRQLDDPES